MARELSLKQLEEYVNEKILLRPVEESVVDDYAMKMRDGVKFPPLIVGHWVETKEHGSRGIIDGMNRFHAAKMANQLYKANISGLLVEEIKYTNVLEALADMVKYNTSHGLRITPKWRNKRILELQGRGMLQNQIAKVFGLSEMSISRIVKGMSGDPETANERRSTSQKDKKKKSGSFDPLDPKPFMTAIQKIVSTLASKKATKELADFLDPETDDKKLKKEKDEDIDVLAGAATAITKFVNNSLS